MEIAEMRKKIAKAWPYCNSMRWQNRVRGMREDQVYAVYRDFQKRGVFDKKKPKKPKYEQITIFDYYGEEVLR